MRFNALLVQCVLEFKKTTSKGHAIGVGELHNGEEPVQASRWSSDWSVGNTVANTVNASSKVRKEDDIDIIISSLTGKERRFLEVIVDEFIGSKDVSLFYDEVSQRRKKRGVRMRPFIKKLSDEKWRYLEENLKHIAVDAIILASGPFLTSTSAIYKTSRPHLMRRIMQAEALATKKLYSSALICLRSVKALCEKNDFYGLAKEANDLILAYSTLAPPSEAWTLFELYQKSLFREVSTRAMLITPNDLPISERIAVDYIQIHSLHAQGKLDSVLAKQEAIIRKVRRYRNRGELPKRVKTQIEMALRELLLSEEHRSISAAELEIIIGPWKSDV